MWFSESRARGRLRMFIQRCVLHAVTIASLLFRQRTHCHNLSWRKWPTKFKQEFVDSRSIQRTWPLTSNKWEELTIIDVTLTYRWRDQVWLENRRTTFCPLLLGYRLVDDPWVSFLRWVHFTRDLYTLTQIWALSPKINCRHTKSIYCICYSSKHTNCHSQTYLQLIKSFTCTVITTREDETSPSLLEYSRRQITVLTSLHSSSPVSYLNS